MVSRKIDIPNTVQLLSDCVAVEQLCAAVQECAAVEVQVLSQHNFFTEQQN